MGTGSWGALTHLGLPQQLLELVLGQQPVVLDERRHLGWPLRLVINCAMDLHVLVEDGQELLLALGRGQTCELHQRMGLTFPPWLWGV